MNGIDKLRSGDFNTMNQDIQPDSSVIVTLSKRGEPEVYCFQVYTLYGKDEEVLVEAIRGQ